MSRAHPGEGRFLEQPLGKVAQVLLPRVPVVPGVRVGAVELILDPSPIQRIHRVVDIVVRDVCGVADIEPEQIGTRVDGVYGERVQSVEPPGSERTDVGELSWVAGQHVERLAPAHGESGQRTLSRIVADVQLPLRGPGDVAEQLVGKVGDVAVAHDHGHRLDLPGGVEVVEDLRSAAYLHPVPVTLRTTVLQVEHRVGLGPVSVVVRRRPGQGGALFAGLTALADQLYTIYRRRTDAVRL